MRATHFYIHYIPAIPQNTPFPLILLPSAMWLSNSVQWQQSINMKFNGSVFLSCYSYTSPSRKNFCSLLGIILNISESALPDSYNFHSRQLLVSGWVVLAVVVIVQYYVHSLIKFVHFRWVGQELLHILPSC